MNKKDFLYTVIIPVYNSENTVEKTVRETMRFFISENLRYEIVLVNDHSKDHSWDIIRSLAKREESVLAINLLKNYGQHTAVFCGLTYATGDFLITMDDDMQNPPEEIIHLINKIHEGYDAVFAEFRKQQSSLFRKIGTRIIGYLNKKIFSKPPEIKLTNFRIFRKEVADRIKNYKTFYPYIPGLVLMFSSSLGNVLTEHHSRDTGKSNYTLWKIFQLVGRLLFAYSVFPLKFLSVIGFFIALASFLMGVFYLYKSIFFGVQVPGWTTVVVMLSFLNGFIIIILGVIGEYLGRILTQLSTSKSFEIKEIVKKDA